VFFARASPNGDRIAHRSNERDDRENQDTSVVAADGSETRRLDVGVVGAHTQLRGWHPDGDRVLLDDDSEDANRAGLYDTETNTVTWYGTGEYDEAAKYVLPEGDRVLVLRTRACEEIPVVYDVDDPDGGRELALPDGTAGLSDGPQHNGVLADGRVLVTHESPATRETVLAYDVETDATETLVDADYGRFDPDDVADCDLVTYASPDGLDIEALCYDSGERPSPAIVLVHGGPHWAETKRFNAQMQFLVTASTASSSRTTPGPRAAVASSRTPSTATGAGRNRMTCSKPVAG
jgi:dipeptidyl aminopeptidase/acylaminoacyl peptidase